MGIDSCYQLGYIIKPHGTKGEVQIFLDVDQPENYKKLESVFVELNKKLVPFFINSFQVLKDKVIAKFEDIDSISQSEELVGCSLYLPLDTLPPPEEGKFYYHQIIGYLVKDKTHGDVGTVQDIFELPHHELFAFEFKGKEILAPLHESLIVNVDHTNKIFHVDLPDGLLDLYLED